MREAVNMSEVVILAVCFQLKLLKNNPAQKYTVTLILMVNDFRILS